ncbi:MAG: glycosyl hydrolase family 18 protein [Capsulimonas sp.]|uniref:glycosyl hydrolase family 18 protein n=1 Tax=Capsulimonas sp. TaxID=2494211 RepID=UPI003265A9A2
MANIKHPVLAAPNEEPKFRSFKHPIAIWVPPYAIAESKTALTSTYGDAGPQDAITHLDLQFWTPTTDGGVAYVTNPGVNDTNVTDLRDWGHAHSIRVMLCVYNGATKWDWPLARAAFADHKDDFVKNLLNEMDRLELDGIDIDLEGPGETDKDKAVYIAFVTDLSKELRKRRKHLTADTFSYIWNAPNQSWWPDLFPLVDGVTTMGYSDIGMNGADWAAYAAQKKAAGKYAAKLQIGVPSDKEQWQGNTALEQMQWLMTDSSMGVAIWDAQLISAAWKTPEVWRAVQGDRDGVTQHKQRQEF